MKLWFQLGRLADRSGEPLGISLAGYGEPTREGRFAPLRQIFRIGISLNWTAFGSVMPKRRRI